MDELENRAGETPDSTRRQRLVPLLADKSRDELRYILDPTDIMGDDYPSKTFRVLKNNELRTYGEYRTRLLVLEAWDTLEKEYGQS